MPLSELVYRMTKGKLDSSQEENPTCSTDVPFGPENDFGELVWGNGQIQSGRVRKIQTCNNLPSQIPKIRDKEIGNSTSMKMGKFGAGASVPSEIPLSVRSSEMGLHQDDDVVPWLNYPIGESLQHDYCSEFLPELSGVTVNENSSLNNFGSFEKRSSCNQSIKNSLNVSVHDSASLEQGNLPKVSLTVESEAIRPRTTGNRLYPSPSQHCQTSFPYFRSVVPATDGDGMTNTSKHPVSADLVQVPTSLGGFPCTKMQKQVPVPSSTNTSLMNFSHFLRPVTLVKNNLQKNSVTAGSGISSIERMGSNDKGLIASSSNNVKSTIRMETVSDGHPLMVSSQVVDAKPQEAKPSEKLVPAFPPEAVNQEDESKNDRNCSKNLGESAIKGLADGENTIELAVASSSVCSGNSAERDDPTQTLKRKQRDTEESEGPSEDVEEESVGAKKAASARGTSSKRSRAAEVHNLSERRRRDRINEKMRALQELIPNCNKVDKASMLDEAIEYLKTLQLQVQIMSMGAGLYMPPMMLPPGMPHMHAAHVAQFSPMGVGMTMGMGMGFGMGMADMNGMQMPPMQGTRFPGLPLSGPGALHGMGGSNLQMFALSSQGLPMPFPRAPLMPMSGGPLVRPSAGLNSGVMFGPVDNLDSAPASTSKVPSQNVSPQLRQNNGSNITMNQTSSQCQGTNEGLEQSALVQNNGQASEGPAGALMAANGNDNNASSTTAAGLCLTASPDCC